MSIRNSRTELRQVRGPERRKLTSEYQDQAENRRQNLDNRGRLDENSAPRARDNECPEDRTGL